MALKRLSIFTRYPTPGQTKTRLIPSLGPAGAADLHRDMTRHTLATADALARTTRVEVEIRFTGESRDAMAALYGDDRSYQPQSAGDLGQRLAAASSSAFDAGVHCIVFIGTDCPQLSTSILRQAFILLDRHDVAIGPAEDGGYYLLGLRRHFSELFTGIEWGTDHVFAQTLAVARRLGLSVARLQLLADIDRPEDLPLWQARFDPPPAPR